MTRSPMSRKEIHMDERTELARLIREMTPEQFNWFLEKAKPILIQELERCFEKEASQKE